MQSGRQHRRHAADSGTQAGAVDEGTVRRLPLSSSFDFTTMVPRVSNSLGTIATHIANCLSNSPARLPSGQFSGPESPRRHTRLSCRGSAWPPGGGESLRKSPDRHQSELQYAATAAPLLAKWKSSTKAIDHVTPSTLAQRQSAEVRTPKKEGNPSSVDGVGQVRAAVKQKGPFDTHW